MAILMTEIELRCCSMSSRTPLQLPRARTAQGINHRAEQRARIVSISTNNEDYATDDMYALEDLVTMSVLIQESSGKLGGRETQAESTILKGNEGVEAKVRIEKGRGCVSY